MKAGHVRLTLSSVPKMDVPFLKLLYSGKDLPKDKVIEILNKWSETGRDMLALDGKDGADNYMSEVYKWLARI